MEREIKIAGVPVKVVSQLEAEKADFVMCMWLPKGQRYFEDDVESECYDCGDHIIHRPHVAAKPVKVCLSCAKIRILRATREP